MISARHALVCLLLASAMFTASALSAGDGDRPRNNPTIKADIAALKAARKKFQEDRDSHDMAKLKADHEAVKEARRKLLEDIKTLRKDHDPAPATTPVAPSTTTSGTPPTT